MHVVPKRPGCLRVTSVFLCIYCISQTIYIYTIFLYKFTEVKYACCHQAACLPACDFRVPAAVGEALTSQSRCYALHNFRLTHLLGLTLFFFNSLFLFDTVSFLYSFLFFLYFPYSSFYNHIIV